MPPPSCDVPGRRKTLLKVVSAGSIVFAGTLALAFHFVSVLRDPDLSSGIVSRGLWQRTVLALGGEILRNAGGEVAEVPMISVVAGVAGLSTLAWLAGAFWISRRRRISYAAALSLWGRNGWLWWLLPIAWETFGIVSELAGSTTWQALCRATLPLWHSTLWAGWLATFVMLARRPAAAGPREQESDRSFRASCGSPSRCTSYASRR